MNQLTAPSILSLFDTTKEQRMSFVAAVINELESGNADALKLHNNVKCMEQIIKQLNESKEYKAHVLEAAEKYGSKEFEYGNAKIKIGEVGTKYDYSQCNDSVLADLTAQAEAINEQLKARQKFLQTVPAEGLEVVNGDTVERVYPPCRSATTSVIVTLK